jgi:hypothetical protein
MVFVVEDAEESRPSCCPSAVITNNIQRDEMNNHRAGRLKVWFIVKNLVDWLAIGSFTHFFIKSLLLRKINDSMFQW